MDFVEINKLTQKKRRSAAEDHLMKLSNLTKEDCVVIIAWLLRREYGTRLTVEVIHTLGVKNLKI